MIENLKMIDIEPTNDLFTWNNRRGGMHQIACRLDHFLIMEHTLLEGWNIEASIIPAINSDHWLINMIIDLHTPTTNRLFRFEIFWLKHMDFTDKIKKWWEESRNIEGTIMYRFQQHLKAIKVRLKH